MLSNVFNYPQTFFVIIPICASLSALPVRMTNGRRGKGHFPVSGCGAFGPWVVRALAPSERAVKEQ